MIFDQSPAYFDIVSKRFSGTQLPEPSFSNQVGKSPKIKYRDVNSVTFACSGIFDEITPASGTVVLNERFAGFDFYLPAFDNRPTVAVPGVLIHRKQTPANAIYKKNAPVRDLMTRVLGDISLVL